MRFFSRLMQSLLLFSLMIVTTMCRDEQKGPPNILLVSLDACRADHLSCCGYHRKTSPFIDQVSSSGIRFSNAFVNTHGTTTSHTTLLSSLYQECHKVDYYNFEDPIPTNVVMLQEILKAHGYVTLGVTDGGRMFRRFGFDRGFVEYNDHGGGILPGTKKLTKLIRQYLPTKKPIFAFYHTYEIHSPYFPPKKYKKIFGEHKSDFVPSSENLLKIKDTKKDLSDNDLEFIRAMYDAGIRYTDDTLKEFFAKLEELGFFDNYLLIITADHGEEIGEHGGVLHRGLLYDELLHVPLIIAGTNIPRGIEDKRMVSTVDIVPTIMDYLDIAMYTPAAGHSLLTQKSKKSNRDEIVFSQYSHSRYSIRTPGWKFILNLQPPAPGVPEMELYDLKKDPGERHNIAPQKPVLAANFRERISDWKEKYHQSLDTQDLTAKKPSKNKFTEKQIEQLKTLGYITPANKSKKETKTGHSGQLK
jgi:arylsulfatase A-like enzyme